MDTCYEKYQKIKLRDMYFFIDKRFFGGIRIHSICFYVRCLKSTRQKAMVGLEAELQGLLKSPVRREPQGDFEFVDGDGVFWDVKTPTGDFFDAARDGASVQKQLRNDPNVRVILDNKSQKILKRGFLYEKQIEDFVFCSTEGLTDQLIQGFEFNNCDLDRNANNQYYLHWRNSITECQ